MQLLVQLVAVVRGTVLGVVVDHDPDLPRAVGLLVGVVKLGDVPRGRRREKEKKEEEGEEGEKERGEERKKERKRKGRRR